LIPAKLSGTLFEMTSSSVPLNHFAAIERDGCRRVEVFQ